MNLFYPPSQTAGRAVYEGGYLFFVEADFKTKVPSTEHDTKTGTNHFLQS